MKRSRLTKNTLCIKNTLQYRRKSRNFPCCDIRLMFMKIRQYYVPYNDFENPNISNKKEFTITETNDEKTCYIRKEHDI